MGKLLNHILSPEVVAERERLAKEHEAEQIVANEKRYAEIEEKKKRYADNTIIDTLTNLETDGWFNANRTILNRTGYIFYVIEHPLLPYALVHYYIDDYVITSRKNDKVRWHKCELIETQAYTIERLDGQK